MRGQVWAWRVGGRNANGQNTERRATGVAGDDPAAGASSTSQTDGEPGLPRTARRWLPTIDRHATLWRLFTSQHVKDLRVIFWAAFALVLLVLIVGVVLLVENVLSQIDASHTSTKSLWALLPPSVASSDRHLWFVGTGNFLTYVAPMLAVFGAVLAWTYRNGSARLGVVDLFACEIDTLCRVAAIVEAVGQHVQQFERGPFAEATRVDKLRATVSRFTSQENYFPVFEGNTRDLQTLEASVVINITAFYTYMKAVRDKIRALAEVRPGHADLKRGADHKAVPNRPEQFGPWHDAAGNVIYMLFLAMESARKATRDLVEFEPELAERTIVILMSELVAYRFLRNQFKDESEMHYRRIILREAAYETLEQELPHLIRQKMTGEKVSGSNAWEPAAVLLEELQKRFQERTSPFASPRYQASA